jgi:hypothetical protein
VKDRTGTRSAGKCGRFGVPKVIESSRLDDAYGSIVWSSSGDWVFFNAGEGKVMAYSPGSEGAQYVPIDSSTPFYGLAAD